MWATQMSHACWYRDDFNFNSMSYFQRANLECKIKRQLYSKPFQLIDGIRTSRVPRTLSEFISRPWRKSEWRGNQEGLDIVLFLLRTLFHHLFAQNIYHNSRNDSTPLKKNTITCSRPSHSVGSSTTSNGKLGGDQQGYSLSWITNEPHHSPLKGRPRCYNNLASQGLSSHVWKREWVWEGG